MTGSGLPRGSPPTAAGNHGERLLASGYQGAVWLVQSPGGVHIVKRATGRGPMRALRLAMLRREAAIYERLRGVAGIPESRGIDADGQLVLAFVAGPSLRERRLSPDERDVFFTELRDLILSMHRAGVAHGDLKRKDNVLVGPGGHPFLIDFGTAIAAPPGAGWLRRAIYRQVCRVDLNAWFKLKYQRGATEVDAADLRYYDPTLPERVARLLRRAWRKVTLRRWRRTGS